MFANLPAVSLSIPTMPITLPSDATVQIRVIEGIPVMKATQAVQTRINLLIDMERVATLSTSERNELDSYEQLDDYLSFMNRVVRNLILTKSPILLTLNAAD